ncbi:MAG: UbiA family prenyltransferase [Pikeienuella sp.]
MSAQTVDGAKASQPRALPALAVDLDRTLLKTDLLAECAAQGLASRPVSTLLALAALFGPGGRAALKARLAEIASPDPATLPYEAAVIAEIDRARAAGREVALVSASDARLVRGVADHLGRFDMAIGSQDGRNLKGTAKAEALVARYGRGGFDYLGDARADLAVWSQAHEAVTVGARARLRQAVEAAAPSVRHIAPPPTGFAAFAPYLRAMRPHQWLKNALVLLPPAAAHATDFALWAAAILAAVAFSLAASAVYLLNDLLDLAADRAHPRKRDRPFAAGSADLLWGAALGGALALLAAVLAAMLPAGFALTLAIYGAMTVAYSMYLKRRLMIDIVTLAGLYTLRVLAGGMATGVVLSPWLFGFSGFLFLALAAVKRQAELVDAAKAGRSGATGRAWRAEDAAIAAMIALSAGQASLVVLAIYITGADVQKLYAAPQILWAVCPVLIYWLGRMVLLAHRGQMHDDPLAFAVRDPTSLACAGAIGAIGLAASVG